MIGEISGIGRSSPRLAGSGRCLESSAFDSACRSRTVGFERTISDSWRSGLLSPTNP